jgi:hypothetical protein
MVLPSSARLRVWERSAHVPAPSLTKAWHGCCGSLSSTNVPHLRATARWLSPFCGGGKLTEGLTFFALKDGILI